MEKIFFFVIKPKRKPKLSIIGAPVTLEEIAKLDKIREQFRSKSQFFIKNVPSQYLGLWGLMKQKILLSCEQNHDSMKRFKNSSECSAIY